MEETNRGFTIKDLLIRLILIIIFIFLLIWLFPMPDLKPLNNQIFADNLDRMKNAAKSYYTVERLPKNINDYEKMTLKEMIKNNLILKLMDSNGNYCSEDDSYVKITKLENEYIIKVYLSCSDQQDYIIEHYGCYDICSDTCKMLETTTTTTAKNNTTNKKTTTKTRKVTTTKNVGKIYEYQFVKNECEEKFDSYVCPVGYSLIGESCVKTGSSLVRTDATKKVDYVTSTDTKQAKAVTTSSSKTVDASCKTNTETSTINANESKQTVNAIATTITSKVTANKVTTKDVKGAVATTVTTNANYITVQNYSVITATKYVSSYKWVYDYTTVSTKGNLAYVKDNEKLVYVDSWVEPTCSTCFTTVTKYKYYHYVKQVNSYSYSCDNFPGYTLYDGDKCRKPTTTTKKCPDGYEANGSVCSKKETTYSCSSYGSDYVLDKNAKTCTKTIVSYNCDGIGEKTSDPKYCTKKETTYSCPSGTTSIGNNKCSKTVYSCPSDTSTKTYTLNGSKCIVKTKVQECTCPSGTAPTNDKTKCIKKTSSTTYTCDSYPGYKLTSDNKCVKTTTTEKVTYTCPNGGILDGTTCVKTVNTSDTKSAEKNYKTVCEQKYIWSTKTSISGWSYTGNKRQIN